MQDYTYMFLLNSGDDEQNKFRILAVFASKKKTNSIPKSKKLGYIQIQNQCLTTEKLLSP